MRIVKLIQSHKELSELPFLVVYKTICVLQKMQMLKFKEEENVETAQ